MDRFAAGMHALELVNDLAPEGEKSGGLLKLLYYALSYIAFTDKDPMDLAICFTIKCLALLGYTPVITSCACCGQDIRGHVRMGFDHLQRLHDRRLKTNKPSVIGGHAANAAARG